MLLPVACGSSDDPEVFLGPVGGATLAIPSPTSPPTPSCTPPEIPELPSFSPEFCPASFSGAVPLGLATSSGGLVLITQGELRALDLGSDGCPGDLLGAPVAVPSATGPVALSGRLWFADAAAVQVWNAGVQEGSCALPGVRSLVISGADVLAVTGGSVRRLEATGQGCSVGDPWSLPGAPLAAGASFGGGAWVATTQSGVCSAAPVVNRYSADGAADEGAPVLEATRLGLCSVSALAEVGDHLLLLDGTCGRAVVVNATSGKAESRWDVPPGQTVAGVAAGASGVLLATASGASASATLRFARLAL